MPLEAMTRVTLLTLCLLLALAPAAALAKGGDDGARNVLVSEQPGDHVHREMRG